MQEGTYANVSPHHIVILVEVPEYLRAHDLVAAIDMAQVAHSDHEQVPLRDAALARDDGAENRDTGEQNEDVAGGVRKDERRGRHGQRGCRELFGDELGRRVPGGVPANEARGRVS